MHQTSQQTRKVKSTAVSVRPGKPGQDVAPRSTATASCKSCSRNTLLLLRSSWTSIFAKLTVSEAIVYPNSQSHPSSHSISLYLILAYRYLRFIHGDIISYPTTFGRIGTESTTLHFSTAMALHTPKADRHHTTHDASPPIVQKMLTPTHPLVTEKDKSIHSEHGVIHYPWYFGGTASCASVMCTQPLGVGMSMNIRLWHIREG